MKYEKYISLIKRLENHAQTKPGLYRFQVLLIGILGYAYFAFLISVPLLIIAAVVGSVIFFPSGLWLLLKVLGKIIWLLAIAAFGAISSFWGAVKAMFVQVEPPAGIEIQPVDAPQLFNDVKAAGDFLKAPKPDHILVNTDFNAAVINLPQRGIFGTRSYLCLGLPLMESLSPQQLKAVIAHEMGHFSGRHGKSSRWIYQMRQTWARFVESQELQDVGSVKFLYEPFLNWYFPYFDAHSFVLARQQEREADKMATQITGAQPLAEALISLDVKSRLLQQSYWKDIYDLTKTQANPPEQVFSKMFTALREPKEEAAEMLAFKQSLAVRTDYSDTHPSLNERLKSLGFDYDKNEYQPSASSEINAAQFYLGKLAVDLTKKFDNEWQREVSEAWKAQHKYFGDVEKRVAELNEKSQTETLTDNELYELADLTASKHDAKSAVPILKELLERSPDFAWAHYSLGVTLLDEDDECGIEMLEKAQKLDPSLAIPALERIYAFLFTKNRDEEAAEYLKRIEEFYDVAGKAQKERETVTDQDQLKTHGLSAEIVEKVKTLVSYHDEITAAYLVEKDVRYFPEQPCYVLGIKIKKQWFKSSSAIKDEDLIEAVANQVGQQGIHYVVNLNKFSSLEKRMQEISSAIYQA